MLGLGLDLPTRAVASKASVPPWVINRLNPPDIFFDFRRDRAWRKSGGVVSASSLLSTSRASSKYAVDSGGNWTSFASGVPALPDLGLSVEEARTNYIRNNSMQGAVAGTPGTLPTNWSINVATPGLSYQTDVGTENGIEGIYLRVFGTANGSNGVLCNTETTTTIAAANGQTWGNSVFHRLTAGSLNGVSLSLATAMRASGGAALGSLTQALVPTASLARAEHISTLNNASTAYVMQQITFTTTNGAAVDFTLFVGWPQLELGASVTSPIRTAGAAMTRAADMVTIDVAAGLWLWIHDVCERRAAIAFDLSE